MNSRKTVDLMFDKVAFKCTKCGAAMGTCHCWDQVMLKCPQCKRTKQVTKDDTDPAGTARVEVLCDLCDDGGNKPGIDYFNALGQWFNGERFVTTRR